MNQFLTNANLKLRHSKSKLEESGQGYGRVQNAGSLRETARRRTAVDIHSEHKHTGRADPARLGLAWQIRAGLPGRRLTRGSLSPVHVSSCRRVAERVLGIGPGQEQNEPGCASMSGLCLCVTFTHVPSAEGNDAATFSLDLRVEKYAPPSVRRAAKSQDKVLDSGAGGELGLLL